MEWSENHDETAPCEVRDLHGVSNGGEDRPGLRRPVVSSKNRCFSGEDGDRARSRRQTTIIVERRPRVAEGRLSDAIAELARVAHRGFVDCSRRASAQVLAD